MTRRQRAPTMADVARRAGLSTASVSRALSGARRVGPDVADRARRAAAELGYHPDQVARALRRQETQTIGLVVADITNPFFPLLVQAVEQEIRSDGFGLLLADGQNDVSVEREAVSLLLARRVDALLITPCHRHRSRPTVEHAAASVTVVQLDRTASPAAHTVGIDHDQAIADILDHLVATGRRAFAFIGSDTSISTSWERQRAFVKRISAVDPAAVTRVLAGDFTVEWGRAAAGHILDTWPEVDAIVCANDLIALGALHQLDRRGVAVPGAVAVTGFDDTLIAVAGQPELTSVRQPLREMARRAVELMKSTLSEDRHAERHRLAATLVVRASSAGS